MASRALIYKSDQIFTIVISNQFKTGVRLRLTSSVKELGAILQKLINLDKIQNEKTKNRLRLAMRMNLGLVTSVVGSVQTKNGKNWSHKI